MSLHGAADQVEALRVEARRRASASIDHDGPRGRVVCGECGGIGMVETDATGQGTFRPCERCRPGPHRRWAGGHHATGHYCADCRR